MTNIEIVPATAELLNRFFGKPPIRSVKAVVAVKDDVPIGVSGIFLDRSRYILFSNATPEILKHKKTVVRMVRETKRIIESVTIPVYAVEDEEISNNAIILKHLGFTEEQDGVYVWHS